jgi:hypothetical protein
MSDDKQMILLNGLQDILEKQISLARQGNVTAVERLVGQAGSLMGKVVESGVLERTEFEGSRKRLQGLYKELCLSLTAQKAAVARELNRIRKGKKTIGIYRSNI